MTYQGSAFAELDVDAVTARHPQMVLIDELVHTNIPGSGMPSGGRTSRRSSTPGSR